MAIDERYLELLRRKAAGIKESEGPAVEGPPSMAPAPADPAALDLEAGRSEAANLEAIILWHRPVLWIRSDEFEKDYKFTDPNDRSSPEILKLLEQRRTVLAPSIPAVGRIEVENNDQFEWVGTGWVLANDLGSDIVITNAHVGREFAQRSGTGFKFRRGTIDFSRPQSARIDFREEIVDGNPREFAITEVIWISENEVLDMALLRVAARSGEDRLSGPIRLAPEAAVPGRKIAVIGYPGDDSRSYDAEKFVSLFGRVFGKKRLAPGRLNEPHAWGLRHDCSTLPGNSGSVVLDIETGGAIGLHYSGSMFRANYAVPAAEILRITRERPWQPEIVAPRAPLVDPSSAGRVQAGGADGLAATFRNHLEQDFDDNSEAARTESPAPPPPTLLVPDELLERPRRPARFKAFAPKILSGQIKVQPLLTPDNYPEVILDLISQAQDRVLIQNQSFSLWNEIDDTPEHFLEIAKAVRQKQRDGLDVRIIFRNIMGSERETTRRLKKFGIKTGKDHLRYFGTCHTKGIVIDDEIAVLGSQNWTAAGTGPNRDASLVIWHREANKYFADLFEYDWEQIATNRGRTESAPARPIRIVRSGTETPVPPGYRRMSVADYLGET